MLLETQILQAQQNVAQQAYISNDIANNVIDGEPDIFSFNVQGYSGKFYIDKNHNAQFIPKQDLILQVDADLKGFTIIAPDGTRYIFGRYLNSDGVNYTSAYEKTLSEGQGSSDETVSSWYLLRIESANQKFKIDLFYASEGYSYLNNSSGKSIKTNTPSLTSAFQTSGSYPIDVYHAAFRTNVSGKKLIQIKSSTQTVNFVTNNIRNDLDDDQLPYYIEERAKSLDKIEVISGDRCQQFDFSYSYFQDNLKANLTIGNKLKLDSIKQKSCDGLTVIPPYIFAYDGNFLAHRLSKAIDHWGFYNGAIPNETKLINIPPTVEVVPYSGTWSEGASNRESNETEMKKGVLTQIKFPTGGSTSFTFEANTVSQSVQQPPQLQYSLSTCASPFDNACCGYKQPDGYYTITQEDINTGTFDLELVKPINGSYPYGNLCQSANMQAYIYVYDPTNWSYVGSLSLPLNSDQASASTPAYPLSMLNISQANKLYYFMLVVTDGFARFRIHNQPWVPTNKQVGGLRIKEIKTNDGISTANDILRQYDYSSPTNASASSGKLLKTPKYAYTLSFNMYTTQYSQVGAGQLTNFVDESIVPLYTFEGNHIGYSDVKEIQNGNGVKVYHYDVSLPNVNAFNYPLPPNEPLVTNGQLASSKILSSSGTKLKETINSVYDDGFTYSVGQIRKAIRLDLPTPPSTGTGEPEYGSYYTLFAVSYQIRTRPYRLASVTETNDNVSTTTTYSYSTDATQPLFPLSTSMVDSDGKTIVNNNKYITHSDYAADPVATRLKQLNIIADPIEVTTTVAGVQINGARTQYSFFDNTSGLPTTSTTNSFPYPNKFYKYKMTWDANGNAQVFGTNSGWELEGTITKFDMTRGKPLSINLRAWENATEADATEKYTWETNGLIKTRTFKGFVWQYEYLPNTRLVNKIIDKDGQFVTYTYDHLQRLKTASARNGAVSTSYTYTYKDPSQSNKSWIETKTTFTSVIGGTLSNNTTYKTIRQYMDGLGRPIQSVAVANSPNMKDVISTVAYDNQGRESLKYDPFESTQTTGAFINTVPSAQPFTKVEYEASPLSRTWKVTPPNWPATTTEYGSNAAGEAYDMTGAATYPANAVNRTITTDPDGRVMKVYTDKKGRKTFTVNVQNNVSGSNYMIYQFDDKDRLRKVFPQRNHWMEWYYAPNLDFKYFYDWDDQIIEKQIPDVAAIYLKYNNRNQLVLSQDGKQRTLNQWLATQYDAFGRPSASGFATTTMLNTDGNPTLNTTLTTTDYSTTAGVTLGKPERTKNYHGIYLESFMQYDSYGRLNNSYSNNHLYSPGGAISATNFSEKVAISYDLADNVLTKTRTHKPNASTTRTILEITDYDNGLRLKRVKHQVDAMAEQIVSQMDYTIKNQVQTKWMGKVGAFNFLQKVDYAYNSLGWLTGINPQALTGVPWSLTNCVYPAGSTMSTTDLDYNDLFSMDLRYENPLQANAPTGTTVTPQYGGNISQITWQVRGREKQSYTFKYDHINRLTEARYADIANNGTIAASNRYDEVLEYDVRGNIKSLQRWGLNASCGWGQIDNLTYHYNTSGDLTYLPTNKLQKVVDASDLNKGFKSISSGSYYTYDSDGNLTADPNKSITNIVYNHLNLPTTITFTNNRSIGFMYDAGGNKLRKTVVDNGVTQYIQDYVGGIEYRTASNVTSLEAIYHSEGRVTTIGGTLKYEYALKDHLGNTRLMFCDKNSNGVLSQSNNQELTEVTQENSYYPFGLNMEGMWMNTPSVLDNKYTYNGKELNSDFGLEWSDYGARFYDGAIGRWNGVDALADGYANWSPYSYALDNPVSFIDPDGNFVIRAGTSDHEKSEARHLKAIVKIMRHEMKSWNNAQWASLSLVTGMSKKDFKNMFKNGRGPAIRFQANTEEEFFLRNPQAYASTSGRTGDIVFGHVIDRIMGDYELLQKGKIKDAFIKPSNSTMSDGDYINSEVGFVQRFIIGVFGHELGHSAHLSSGRTRLFGDGISDNTPNDPTERGFNFERSVIGRILPHNVQSLGNGVIQSYNYYIFISGPGSRSDNNNNSNNSNSNEKKPPRA